MRMSIGGRGVSNRKARVDESTSIDILDLHRFGGFTNGPGLNWYCSWTRQGEVSAHIHCAVDYDEKGPAGVLLSYSVRDIVTGDMLNYTDIVPVVSTPCNYGGERWWFVCTLMVGDTPCNRKCRIIYMPPGCRYFGCRECHQLSYESRQRHRDVYYENFEKPYRTAKAAIEELDTGKFRKKHLKALQRLSLAEAAITRYADILSNRRPKITYHIRSR